MANNDFDLDAFPEERELTHIQPSPVSPIPNLTTPPASVENTRQRRHFGLLALSLVFLAAIAWGAGHYIRQVAPPHEANGGSSVDAHPTTVEVGPADEDRANPAPNNVAGSWALETHVQSSSYSRYEGLHLGYRIQLEQDGARVKGAGRKISQGGGAIGSRGQTPIFVTGTIDGDRLSLTFDERGTRRATKGKFVLLLDESDTLRGRFSSTAARSSGTVEAHRLQQ